MQQSTSPGSSPSPDRFDILRYRDGVYRAVPAGDGSKVVEAHRLEARKRAVLAPLAVFVLPIITALVFGFAYSLDLRVLAVAGVTVGLAAGGYRFWSQDYEQFIPDLVETGVSPRIARTYIDGFDPDDVSAAFD